MNKIKIQCETFEYLNGKLINHKKEYKETECEWKNDYKCNDNISIGKINPMYIEINEIQDVNDEYKKIKKFLNKFLEYYASKNDISIDSLQLEFINYGKIELVYVLKENNMNTLKICVLHCPKQYVVYSPPQGLMSISAYLKSKNVEVVYGAPNAFEFSITPVHFIVMTVFMLAVGGFFTYKFIALSKEYKKIEDNFKKTGAIELG